MEPREQLISLRAYEIWEGRGRPDGQLDDCRRRAEREIDAGHPELGAKGKAAGDRAEGKGTYRDPRAYNKGLRDFEKTGKVGAKAREAAEALDGPEAESLRKAEEIGGSHSHGEDPALRKH